MPLYELFCVAVSSAESAPLRDLIRGTSSLVQQNGGVVRGVQYWGRRYLPQRARRHQVWHEEGDHFLLQFDTNPRVLATLTNRYRADPRVIKWTTLKLGERLHELTPNVNASRLSPFLDSPGAGAELVEEAAEITPGEGPVDRGQMGGRKTINAPHGY